MDESQRYSWDDFKREQKSLRRSEKTHCVICGARLVAQQPKTKTLVCPNGCTDGNKPQLVQG